MAGMAIRCTLLCVARNMIFLVLGLLLIILGIVFLVYGAANYEEKSTEKKSTQERFGVVVDAGGSGTRLIVYKYFPDENRMANVKYTTCEDEGLATYQQSQFPALQKVLQKCFVTAAKIVPQGQEVPLFFGATAGMRLLKLRDVVKYNKVWTVLNSTLEASKFKIMMSNTITGTQEAQWAWIAANYVKKTLKPGDPKYGIIDFGSSSIQMSFMSGGGKAGEKTLNIDGANMTIYGHSYLCFGKREMERRFLAKLVTDASFNLTVENPCYFSGYERNYSSSFLWEQPCSSGAYARDTLGSEFLGPSDKTLIYTLKGTGNVQGCTNVLKSLIDMKCTKSRCGMNDVFQPKVEGNFLALAVFRYAADFMGISNTAKKDVFEEAVKKTCATPWDDIKKRVIPGTPLKYRGSRCFDAVYSYFLLTDGFKFDDDTWNLEYATKVNGQELQWSLGLIYAQKDKMYRKIRSYILQITTRKEGMLALAVFGAVLLVIGLAIFISACIFRRKKGRLPVNTS